MTELPYSPAEQVLALFAEYAPDSVDTLAPIIHRLFNALADGHTFIYVNKDDAAQLSALNPIVGKENTPLVLQGQRLFLGRMFQLEYDLAQEIKRLSTPTHALPDVAHTRSQLQNLFPDTSSHDQQAAAALALLQNFTVISGGPGTGKTTTVAKLLVLLSGDRQPRIALAAPTGKAAARMSEALKNALARIDTQPEHAFLAQLDGQTVHRLLGLKPPQMQPEYHAQHRLPLDILVIDEASMLDAYLLLQLLQALPDHCRVILLGDEHQLPSVNAGAVLAALVHSAFRLPENSPIHQILSPNQLANLIPPVARLSISHRFGADSGIGCLARGVVSGDALAAWAQFSQFPNELICQQKSTEQQAKQLYAQHADYWQAVDNQDVSTAFARQSDVVVLAARRADAAAFNEHYRKILQKQGCISSNDTLWYAGQMLMITRNDPATRLFNGDVGIVLAHGNGLAAWFPDSGNTFRAVPLSRLPAHETAFAMTVHKSQGSEYGEVWLLPPSSNTETETEQGFSRALLYTAITRAKQKFVYWGNAASFQAACENREIRRTALGEFLLHNH